VGQIWLGRIQLENMGKTDEARGVWGENFKQFSLTSKEIFFTVDL
jgi:hypothetical protein